MLALSCSGSFFLNLAASWWIADKHNAHAFRHITLTLRACLVPYLQCVEHKGWHSLKLPGIWLAYCSHMIKENRNRQLRQTQSGVTDGLKLCKNHALKPILILFINNCTDGVFLNRKNILLLPSLYFLNTIFLYSYFINWHCCLHNFWWNSYDEF